MAQDLDLEKNVLLVSNEGSDKLEVISKVGENGELKTVAPKQANEVDFMKFDKHSDMVESFLKNYFAQAKSPKHTGIYLVAATGIESITQVIKGLFNSGEEGKQFLDEYKIDTSKYEQGSNQQQGQSGNTSSQQYGQSNPTPTQSTKSQGEQPVKKEYKPMDAEKIDWAMFEKIGIKREYLEKSGALNDMLGYRRSSELHPITMKVDELTVSTDARLSLRRTDDGRLIPVIHAVRKEPQLDRPFYGNTFTAEDKANLRKSGNLGRIIVLDIKNVDNKINAFVSVDSKTNELIAYNSKNVRIPNEIKGITLGDEQKRALREGSGVYLEGMTSKSGKKFNATIQVNAAERGIVFKFDEPLKQQHSASQKQESVNIPNKIGGVELKPEDISSLKDGKVVYVEGMTDKKGEKYNAYIKVNIEKGKLDFYKWDPRKKQGVTPDSNSSIQTAVNSDGKTNEATKKLSDPLSNGQSEPKNEQQHSQQQRGRKM